MLRFKFLDSHQARADIAKLFKLYASFFEFGNVSILSDSRSTAFHSLGHVTGNLPPIRSLNVERS
jgi:hypothetical protein